MNDRLRRMKLKRCNGSTSQWKDFLICLTANISANAAALDSSCTALNEEKDYIADADCTSRAQQKTTVSYCSCCHCRIVVELNRKLVYWMLLTSSLESEDINVYTEVPRKTKKGQKRLPRRCRWIRCRILRTTKRRQFVTSIRNV